MRSGRARRRQGAAWSSGGQSGFTYLLVLLAVALTSAGLAAGAQVYSKTVEHQNLMQLDWVGAQYRKAIGSYYESSPGTVKRYPPTLEDLVLDHRYLSVKRHLRQLYPDPMTASARWVLIKAPDGGIQGIASADARAVSRRYEYMPVATPNSRSARPENSTVVR